MMEQEALINELLPYCKWYAVIDDDIEDQFIKDEIAAAIADAADSGVPMSMHTDPRYKKLIGMYVTEWYENRTQVQQSNYASAKESFYGIKNLILKMRVTSDDKPS
jgi:hypothetical protein